MNPTQKLKIRFQDSQQGLQFAMPNYKVIKTYFEIVIHIEMNGG